MTHSQQNVDVHHEGDAHELYTIVRTSDDDIVNLTGASAEWLLKEDEKDDDDYAVLTKTGDDGGDETQIEFTAPGEGELKVIIETGDTDGLVNWSETLGTTEDFHHRLRITDSSGRRVTGFHGTFTVHR